MGCGNGEGGAGEGGNFLKILFLWEDEYVVLPGYNFQQGLLCLLHLLSRKDVHSY